MTEIFKKLDFNEFKLKYKSDIRVAVKWDELKRMDTGILLADETTRLFVPRYVKGDWRSGIPKEVNLGKKLVVLRLPAVKISMRITGDYYLLLDGTHRIQELKPQLVILDWIKPTHKQRHSFYDLINMDNWSLDL